MRAPALSVCGSAFASSFFSESMARMPDELCIELRVPFVNRDPISFLVVDFAAWFPLGA